MIEPSSKEFLRWKTGKAKTRKRNVVHGIMDPVTSTSLYRKGFSEETTISRPTTSHRCFVKLGESDMNGGEVEGRLL